MTENKKTGFNPFKTDLRRLIRSWSIKLFKGPYLPKSLVTFFFLEGITFLSIAIMSQPYGFLKDQSLGVNTLGSQPFVFLAGCLLALLVGSFAFSVVNYRIALSAWIVISFVDLTCIGLWVEKCGMSRWFPIVTSCGYGVYLTNLVGSVIIAILITMNFGLYKPKATSIATAPQPIWKSLIIPAAWIVLLAVGIIWSNWKPSSGWLPINIQADKLPSPRGSAQIIYDNSRQRAVMFGGRTAWMGNAYQYTNETWEWDGQQWLKISPEHFPPARADFGMAYDEKRGVTVLFGGETTNGGVLADTWEWNGKDWQFMSTCCCPPARGWHKMVYNPERGKVTVYGGTDNKGKFFSDGWEWDGKTWSQITFNNITPAASAFALVYDPAHQYTLGVLAGWPEGTWTWQGDQWKRLSPEIELSDRSGSGIAYEPESKLIYLFGGWHEKELSDTWAFDGKSWKEYQSIMPPPALSGSMMFYDPIRKHIVLFGGYGQGKYHNEMWELVLQK